MEITYEPSHPNQKLRQALNELEHHQLLLGRAEVEPPVTNWLELSEGGSATVAASTATSRRGPARVSPRYQLRQQTDSSGSSSGTRKSARKSCTPTSSRTCAPKRVRFSDVATNDDECTEAESDAEDRFIVDDSGDDNDDDEDCRSTATSESQVSAFATKLWSMSVIY